MAETPSNQPVAARRRLPLLPLLLILIVLGFALFGQKGILRTLQVHRQYAALQDELRQQEIVIRQLEDEIEALQSDRRYIESLARRELGMVKEDELIYQFAQGSEGEGADSEPSASR